MFRRYIFTVFSVFIVIACAIVILSVSSRSTPVQDERLKAQMQQEIIQALREVIALHEQALMSAQAKQQEAVASSLEVEQAQLKLFEARLRLAVAEHQRDGAMAEFRNILAIHEKQLQLIKSKTKQGLAVSSDVAEMKLQQLEQRIRLAMAIRDMQ